MRWWSSEEAMLAVMLLVADLAGTLDVSDRSELRVRVPGTAPASASVDVETAPRAELALDARTWRARLAYAPRFSFWDLGNGSFQPAVLDGGQVHVAWMGRRVEVALDETGTYGDVGFASQAFEPGPEGQPPHLMAVPATTVVDYASSRTALTSAVTLRRLALHTEAGYELAGGATPSARTVMPLVAGPFGEARADYAVTRVDHSVTRFLASDSAFSTGSDAALLQVDTSWRRSLARHTETRLGAGAALLGVRTSARALEAYGAYPVLMAALEQHAPFFSHVDLMIEGRLGPMVNRLYGIVDERAECTLTAVHQDGRFGAHLFASASQSVDAKSRYATSLAAGELGGSYAESRLVAFDAGVRVLWQRVAEIGVPLLQSTMFLGVRLRAPEARF
jgi:hypothetical protein